MGNRRNLLLGGGAALLGLGGAALAGVRQMGSMEEYRAAVGAMRVPLPVSPEDRDLIRLATLAPNGHNTQPWRFRTGGNRITILPDLSRRTPVVDPDDHHLFISLGGAAETLALAAATAGRGGEVVFDPGDGGSVTVYLGDGRAGEPELFAAIPMRQSTRSDYDGTKVSTEDLALLTRAAAVAGVDLVLITDAAQIARLSDLVIAGNTAQMEDAAFVAELMQWLRFSPNAALRTGDGLFSGASGLPVLPDWLGPLMFRMVFSAKAENRKYASQIATASGIAVFFASSADPDHWVQTGRACQRFALQATALGLKQSFLNQPVEVPGLRADLAALAGMPGRRPDLVMRFGRAPALPFAARRPVGDVLEA